MKETNKNLFKLTLTILLSLVLVSCTESESGESLIAPVVDEERMLDDSEWEEIIVDHRDYDEDEEVLLVSESTEEVEFEYNAKVGECTNKDGEEGTNANDEILCGDFVDKELPLVDLDTEMAFGLDISGSFVSSEQELKIGQLVKYEIKLNKHTIFENQPMFLGEIKKSFEKRILKILKRIDKRDKHYKKLVNSRNKYKNRLENDKIVKDSERELKIKKKLLKINNKLKKVHLKTNRLKIKLKYLDAMVREL